MLRVFSISCTQQECGTVLCCVVDAVGTYEYCLCCCTILLFCNLSVFVLSELLALLVQDIADTHLNSLSVCCSI